MEYTVRYYGQIAELVNISEELIFSEANTIENIGNPATIGICNF